MIEALPASRALAELQLRREADRLGVPPHLANALIQYALDRVRPGGFLSACLANDLMGAVLAADPSSGGALLDVVRFIRAVLHPDSWGSPAAISAWCAGEGGARG